MSGYSIEQSVDTPRKKIRAAPYADLAKAVLERGVKENDRFESHKNWLYILCGLANLHPDNYYAILDHIYGPRNTQKEI